jgi:LysM repeat protein
MNKKATRLATIAAATALGAGAVVAAAPQASAAGTVWDRVAACESGGNWSINTGNGYYGGLQFNRGTWAAYGGTKYAATANKATKAQQIEIAKKTLAKQGPGAWPVCSRKAGLTRANGAAVGTKVTVTAVSKTTKKATPKRAVATPVKAATVKGKRYVVKRGDSLSKIARAQGVKGGWKALWTLNKGSVKNPGVIKIGQVLTIG